MNIKHVIASIRTTSLLTVMVIGLMGCGGDNAEDLLSVVEDGERGLSSLMTSTANIALAVGESAQISVRGLYDNGINAEFTEPVAWVSLDTAVATVGSAGKVVALSEGSTQIRINWRTYSATTNVTVNEAALQGIEFSAPGLEMDACRSATLNATSTYSDGTSRPLPDSASVVLQDTTLGSLVVNPNSSFTVSSTGVGSTSVDISVDNVKASVPVVMLDTLTDIVIAPDLSALTAGEQITLSATGHYSDNSEYEVSGSARWQLLDLVPDESVAELDPLSMDPQILYTLANGSATLEVSCSEVSTSAPIVIAPPSMLESLQIVNGDEVELYAGDEVTFEVLGVYSDGSTKDLSLLVEWMLPAMESESGPFMLSSSDTSSGVITADIDISSEQSTVATASYEQLSASTTVYAERDVEVTLLSLEILLVDSLGNESGASADVPYIITVGDTIQLRADGVYLTGKQSVPEAGVIWSNADPSIATVDAQGLVSAVAEGQTEIGAIFGGQTVKLSVSVVVAE